MYMFDFDCISLFPELSLKCIYFYDILNNNNNISRIPVSTQDLVQFHDYYVSECWHIFFL